MSYPFTEFLCSITRAGPAGLLELDDSPGAIRPEHVFLSALVDKVAGIPSNGMILRKAKFLESSLEEDG